MSDAETRSEALSAPSLIPDATSVLSDDDCVKRLADAIAGQDDGTHLNEVAQLIGRLAVVIE